MSIIYDLYVGELVYYSLTLSEIKTVTFESKLWFSNVQNASFKVLLIQNKRMSVHVYYDEKLYYYIHIIRNEVTNDHSFGVALFSCYPQRCMQSSEFF